MVVVRVNHKFKDSLFRVIFSEKKELLALYNALNGSHYQNPDDLIITTIGDVLYLGMKNDISFLIGQHSAYTRPKAPGIRTCHFGDCSISAAFTRVT